jgi:hypothetical protein
MLFGLCPVSSRTCAANKSSFDLEELLSSTCSLLLPEAVAKQLGALLYIDPGTLRVIGDPTT